MDVFISYSHADKKFVDQLELDLSRKGICVWRYDHRIKVGDSIIEKVNEGIHRSKNFVIVISSNSIKSNWVVQEFETAVTRQVEDKGFRVLPIVVDECELPNSMLVLKHIKYANFYESYATGLSELLEVLLPQSSKSTATQSAGISIKPLQNARRTNWKWWGIILAFLLLLVTSIFVNLSSSSSTLMQKIMAEVFLFIALSLFAIWLWKKDVFSKTLNALAAIFTIIAGLAAIILFVVPGAQPARETPAPEVEKPTLPAYSSGQILEDFNSSQGWKITGSSEEIRNGRLFWKNDTNLPDQFAYKSIEKINGDFRMEVIGQINHTTSNCGVYIGLGDDRLEPNRLAILPGWFGAGCTNRGFNVTGVGANYNFIPDNCSFTKDGMLWVKENQDYKIILERIGNNLTLAIPDIGSFTGIQTYTGEIDTLYIGHDGFPSNDSRLCDGSIEQIKITYRQ